MPASTHAKYQIADDYFTGRTFKLLLMKAGFGFLNPNEYDKRLNLKATTGSISVTFSPMGPASAITRITGSFITDGFASGSIITTTSENNPGPFLIYSVEELRLVISTPNIFAGTVTCTITADDELPTGYGYTQGGVTLENLVITENDTYARAILTWDDESWLAIGGSIGPTPGAILIDALGGDPNDDIIMGYYEFPAIKTIPAGGTLAVTGIKCLIA